MSTLDEEDIVLHPDGLSFVENDTSPSLISIENWSETDVVFRIKASIANILVLGEAGGVIESSTAVEFPVSLKGMLPPDFEHASEIPLALSLDLSPLTEEYESDGVRAFWAAQARTAVKKTVSCLVQKVGATPTVDAAPAAPICPTQPPPSFAESHSFGTFEDVEENETALPAPDSAEPPPRTEPPPSTEPPSSIEAPATAPKSFMGEMRTRQEEANSGLRTAAAAPSKPSRRRSMHDIPSSGSSLFSELKERQESGTLVLNHVETKTAAEKEAERYAALAVVPDGGFTSVVDELKHFSYVLNQSMSLVSEISEADNQDQLAQQARQHAEEMAEKDIRISELNAEIHRLMVQYDDDCSRMQAEGAAQLAAVQRQYEEKLAAQAKQNDLALINAADHEASRVASLTE